MNNKQFLEQLLQTNDVAVIQEIINNNPYFEAAHIAKALQSKDANDLHNASLLLQNELWIQYLLSQNEITDTNTDNNAINTNVSIENKETQNIVINTTTFLNTDNSQNDLDKSEKEEATINIALQSQLAINDTIIAVEKQTIVDKTVFEEMAKTEVEFDITTQDADNTEVSENFETQPITIPLSEANALKSIFSDLKNKKENKVNIDSSPISIEPYHTIDYFASQGIKVLQNNTNDKLSVQLKSFTQWLKTMKKVDVNQEQNERIEELQQHSNVVTLAEDSLIKNDILTENMVEVLVKQGKTNDAITLLQKLSLQDTTKSVYFATRIEQLKKY